MMSERFQAENGWNAAVRRVIFHAAGWTDSSGGLNGWMADYRCADAVRQTAGAGRRQ